MRLIYIAQTCPPEPGATKRPLKQARILKQLGHDVILITAFPSYPLGRIYEPYRGKLWMREVLEDVEVIRVWSFPAPNRGTIRRVLSFITFSISATLAGLRLKRSDCVIASIPKPFTEFAGWVLGRVKGAFFVVELRDLLPDSLQFVNLSDTSIIYRFLKGYYGWMYRRADLFALQSARMERQLKTYGVKNTPCVLVPHAVDFDQLQGDQRDQVQERLGVRHCFVAAYAGSFSPYYRVPFLIEAARVMKSRRSDTRFLLVGTGHDFPAVQSAVQAAQLDNVILTGGVAPDDVFGYLQAADVLIHPQFLPDLMDGTKIVEYLAAARPVINLCDDPSSQTAERLGIGASVGWHDAEALVAAIDRFATDPERRKSCGKAGQAIALAKYDRKPIVKKFAAALEELNRGEDPR